MICSELESLARSGQLEKHLGDPEVVAHLRQCGACEALYAGSGRVGAALLEERGGNPAISPLDLEALRSELDLMLVADSKAVAAPLRDLPTRTRVTISVGLGLGTALATALVWQRPDWSDYPSARMWLALGASAVVAAWALRELFRPLTEVANPARQRMVLVAALALPVLLALVPTHVHETREPANEIVAALACGLLGLGFAVPTAIWVLLAQRSTVQQTPLGWIVAGALGLVGNLALQVHCPFTHVAHLVLGHGLLGLVWGAGLWLGIGVTRRAS